MVGAIKEGSSNADILLKARILFRFATSRLGSIGFLVVRVAWSDSQEMLDV